MLILLKNRSIRKYIRQTKYYFPYIGKKEHLFFQKLQSDLSEYLEDHPAASYEDIVNEFGLPKDLAVNYYDECSVSELVRRFHLRRKAYHISLIIMLTAAAFTCYQSGLAYKSYRQTLNDIGGYETEQIFYDP